MLLLLLLAGATAVGADTPSPAWPTTLEAHYALRYNGIEVGRFYVKSTVDDKAYAMSGSGEVSALFGLVKSSGGSTVAGAIVGGAPSPATYALEWHPKNKDGTVLMRFANRVATEIAVVPPPKIKPDIVPLTPAHRVGVLDPVSALMMLTKADGRPPCDRRVGIFDGTQRYDIVLSFKRVTPLPPPKPGGQRALAFVCRAMYIPVAGHRENSDTKTYAANRDVEVVLARFPGTTVLVPYAVTVPTLWGTGSITTKRIEMTTATGKVTVTE